MATLPLISSRIGTALAGQSSGCGESELECRRQVRAIDVNLQQGRNAEPPAAFTTCLSGATHPDGCLCTIKDVQSAPHPDGSLCTRATCRNAHYSSSERQARR
jgi:hypothetical protein